MSCAEACTVARAQDYHLIPQPVKLLTPTIPQNAAHVHDLSTFVLTYPRSGLIVLLSFAIRGSVHNHSRVWPALYSFGARINPGQVSLREPHVRVDFIAQPRHVPCIDRHPYKVTRCAKTCTTARALDCLLIPFRVEPLIPTALQSAAPSCALGNLVLTCIRPQRPRKLSFAVCKDVHDCSHSQSVPQLIKTNSRSGRDDEGEHDALSWEEIPSPACIPPILPCSSNPGDAPSPRYMRERATWSGRVREVAVPLGLARGKATCLIGPLQSHWAGSSGNGLSARLGALWAGGDATGD